MKVSDHCVDDTKAKTRSDENVRITRDGLQLTAERCALQCAHGRRAHRDHTATAPVRSQHLSAGLLAQLDVLTVHAVLFDMLNAHWLKGTHTDMQGYKGTLETTVADGLQQCLVEVQTGSRGRNRSRSATVDGLVAVDVDRLVSSSDVGRE